MKNTERCVKENLGYRWKISKTDVNPFPCGYEAALEVSQELYPVLSYYYQCHIGILLCMVELGRIGINTEFLVLASHLEFPREVHLIAVLNIVSYLWGKHNYRLSLDSTYPEIDHASFKKHKLVDLYGNVK